MREILFRGKRTDNGEWIYGDLMQNVNCIKIREQEKSIKKIAKSYEVDLETVGQFTGLYDCDGKEIFEGDILDFNGLTVEVRFVRGVFAFLANGDLDEELCGDCRTDLFAKVIGNVYENPDILKGGEQ